MGIQDNFKLCTFMPLPNGVVSRFMKREGKSQDTGQRMEVKTHAMQMERQVYDRQRADE